MDNQDFQKAYNVLEVKMGNFARKNDEIYVPNITPHSPVEYIFICMEPSLGEWARSRNEAEIKLKAGFRNFLDGYNTMILHHAIREYLCENDQKYFITDLSKGAMLVRNAGVNRMVRYKNWYSLLLEEINLVAIPDARVFAVGTHVNRFLNSQNFSREATLLIHYSNTAAMHWNTVVQEHKEAFDQFQNTVSHNDLIATAEDVIKNSEVPKIVSDRALGRLRKGKLTLSRLKLMFNYKISFEVFASKSKIYRPA